MKNLCSVVLFASSCAWLLLCGCSHKPDGDLKTRVERLEAQQKLAARGLDELLALSKSSQVQNQKTLVDLQRAVLLQGSNVDNIGRLFLEHLSNSALHSWPKPGAARSVAPVADQQLKPAQGREGVPLSVYNTIAIQAIKKWPRDYQKRENYIQAELERYKRLQR